MLEERGQLDDGVRLLQVEFSLGLADHVDGPGNVGRKDIWDEAAHAWRLSLAGRGRKVGEDRDGGAVSEAPSHVLDGSAHEYKVLLGLSQDSTLIAPDLEQLLKRCEGVPQSLRRLGSRICADLVSLRER